MNQTFKVGQILENSVRQFTKIISIKNGVYGLSGWSTKDAATKATVAFQHVNGYGLKYAGARVVGGKETPAPTTEDDSPKYTKASLKALGKDGLTALAESLGVDATGKMDVVIERILAL